MFNFNDKTISKITYMKIGILAAGNTPEELRGDYGSYAEMAIELLSLSENKFTYEVFDVLNNIFPDSTSDADGWLITGSRCSVCDNLPWMVRLMKFIKENFEQGRPVVGICFGHQIMAKAMGGDVSKYQGGWGVGVHAYERVTAHDQYQRIPPSFFLNAMHEDQVSDLPEFAEVVATSSFCQYAALEYQGIMLSVQAHPEFTSDYEKALIRLRAGSTIPTPLVEPALKSISHTKTNSLEWAYCMGDFYQNASKIRA